MFIREVYSEIASQSTAQYNALRPCASEGGNLFVGGDGEVDVMNTTDGFICAGGSSSTYLVNQADDCLIKLGDSGSTAISVGENNRIFGGAWDDVVVSIGDNCTIKLGDGADRAAVSGEGSEVDGQGGDDILTGVAAPLNYTELKGLKILDMLAAILANTTAAEEEA